jgi:hypothetical protein
LGAAWELLGLICDGLALKEMEEETLVGIVDLVGGEKDPRNLMLVFSMLKVIMVEWDIENHVEVRTFCPP